MQFNKTFAGKELGLRVIAWVLMYVAVCVVIPNVMYEVTCISVVLVGVYLGMRAWDRFSAWVYRHPVK